MQALSQSGTQRRFVGRTGELGRLLLQGITGSVIKTTECRCSASSAVATDRGAGRHRRGGKF